MEDIHIVSIHIPKTGGSRFRKMLAEAYKDKLFLDYYDKILSPPIGIDYFIKKIYNAINSRRIRLRINKCICFHGHFIGTKYDNLLSNIKYVTWLRDPVERVVSHYYFWKRYPDILNRTCREMRKKRMSLEDFAAVPMMQNVQSRFLNGLNTTDFTFIGLTEYYHDSIELFKIIFNLKMEIDIESFKGNVNPDKNTTKYNLEEKTSRLIEKVNLLDVDLYENGKTKFFSLKGKYLLF